MILVKLKEALGEVDAQRSALNEVEAQLRVMISKLSGVADTAELSLPPVQSVPKRARKESRDPIDVYVDILQSEGHPIHINLLCQRLTELTGEEVVRTKIEPGINRHIAKVKNRRIDKFGPSIYGLPEWKKSSSQRGLLDDVA